MTKEVLFDRNLLRQNKLRSAKIFHEHNFLHHEIANRIAENIELLNRDFKDILEIGAIDKYLSEVILRGSRAEDRTYNFYPDEENLFLKSESFDLVLSNLNLHYINQIPQFLLQVREALKPNGVFISSFFGEENLSELADILYQTENEIYGGISPRMPPTIDVKTAAYLLSKAGFNNPISDFDKIEIQYSDPMTLLRDLKNMGQGNILLKRSRRFMTKNFLEKILQNYRKIYQNSHNKVRATFEIVTIAGWK